ncbi:predicted protein [Chaetoceros tenuissimus]|uniref:Uncharacterized protein n=1 Tax=Chaetoceros tenuissimus TaxID=426638 RepID=A0AAD3CRW2_9STRA|nr:predicted protein [Chaetoceros tenuissimus]GFH50664.1 predicted protein [Chaetoceros tenuissimus]
MATRQEKHPEVVRGSQLYNAILKNMKEWFNQKTQQDIIKAGGKLTFPKPSHFYEPCYSMAKAKLHDLGTDAKIKTKLRDIIKQIKENHFAKYVASQEENKAKVDKGVGSPNGKNPPASFFDAKATPTPKKKPAAKESGKETEMKGPNSAKKSCDDLGPRIQIDVEKTLKNPPFVEFDIEPVIMGGHKYLFIIKDIPPCFKKFTSTSSPCGRNHSYTFTVPKELYKNAKVLVGSQKVGEYNLLCSVFWKWEKHQKAHEKEEYTYTLSFVLPFDCLVPTGSDPCPSLDFPGSIGKNNKFNVGGNGKTSWKNHIFTYKSRDGTFTENINEGRVVNDDEIVDFS